MRGYEQKAQVRAELRTALRIPMRGYEGAGGIVAANAAGVTHPHEGL